MSEQIPSSTPTPVKAEARGNVRVRPGGAAR